MLLYINYVVEPDDVYFDISVSVKNLYQKKFAQFFFRFVPRL